MKELLIQIAAIIVAAISGGIALFQFLLFFGLPLAVENIKECYLKKMRIMSWPSALLLLFFGLIFLIHSKVLSVGIHLPTKIFVIMITIFMGLNTLGNLVSKSNKERLVMTPLAGITFLSCLLVLIFS
ncbi:hypothetical protein [Neobacillus terrae]|uniref:hypothetical protein n=1 Tax=Neobacillus terrae TaxID=3034837 RepID=UPI001FB1014D|nr:hypothetical protein [Neobacillus terrae]